MNNVYDDWGQVLTNPEAQMMQASIQKNLQIKWVFITVL